MDTLDQAFAFRGARSRGLRQFFFCSFTLGTSLGSRASRDLTKREGKIGFGDVRSLLSFPLSPPSPGPVECAVLCAGPLADVEGSGFTCLPCHWAGPRGLGDVGLVYASFYFLLVFCTSVCSYSADNRTATTDRLLLHQTNLHIKLRHPILLRHNLGCLECHGFDMEHNCTSRDHGSLLLRHLQPQEQQCFGRDLARNRQVIHIVDTSYSARCNQPALDIRCTIPTSRVGTHRHARLRLFNGRQRTWRQA